MITVTLRYVIILVVGMWHTWERDRAEVPTVFYARSQQEPTNQARDPPKTC